MTTPNVIIAILLMVITSILGYAFWYILWGKHRKGAPEALPTDAGKTPSVSPMAKNAYCYPRINDVMGYEFISVVKIPEELTSTQKQNEVGQEQNEANYDGRLTGATATEHQEQDDPNLPEEESCPGNNNASEKENGEEYEVAEMENISPYELEQLNKMAPWTNRDYDETFSDAEIDAIINSNPGIIINDGESDEESLRVAKEQDLLKTIENMKDEIEMTDSAEEAHGIMEAIRASNELDPSDVPDI